MYTKLIWRPSWFRKELGFSCKGSDSGSAKALAEYIIKDCQNKNSFHLLFPCSALANRSLEASLEDASIGCHRIDAYETISNEALEGLIGDLGVEDIAVFFSPSGLILMFFVMSSCPCVLFKSSYFYIGKYVNHVKKKSNQVLKVPWDFCQVSSNTALPSCPWARQLVLPWRNTSKKKDWPAVMHQPQRLWLPY